MKKLTKINLKDAAILSDNQMKSVYGGTIDESGLLAGCAARCIREIVTYGESGQVIKTEEVEVIISISCKGTCTATDGVGVFCSGEGGKELC